MMKTATWAVLSHNFNGPFEEPFIALRNAVQANAPSIKEIQCALAIARTFTSSGRPCHLGRLHQQRMFGVGLSCGPVLAARCTRRATRLRQSGDNNIRLNGEAVYSDPACLQKGVDARSRHLISLPRICETCCRLGPATIFSDLQLCPTG